MAIKIHVNSKADDLSAALVRSEVTPNPVRLPDAFKGDKTSYQIAPVDGEIGDFDDALNADIDHIRAAIGNAPTTPYYETTNWTKSGDYWSGFIDFSGATLASAIGSEERLETLLELRFVHASTSYAQTYLQAPLTIKNRVAN